MKKICVLIIIVLVIIAVLVYYNIGSFNIKNKEDKSFILNNISNQKAKIKRISKGETLLGGSCRFVIENNVKNTRVNINVQSTQISINGRVYKTYSNIWEYICNIVKKYDVNTIG